MALKQLQERFHKNMKMVQHRKSAENLENIQIYRNFKQRIEAYEGHSHIVKAAKMLYNTTTSRGQTGGRVL